MTTCTVSGKLKMALFSGVGCQTSITALQTSTAKSTSVDEKLSGEYSNTHSVSGYLRDSSCTLRAPCIAISIMPCLSNLNTLSRCTGEVELYKIGRAHV